MNKWDIVLVDLNPVRGSEQGKTRPCLIVSASDLNAVLPVVNILPITTYKEKKVYSNQEFIKSNDSGLNSDSVILSFQIRTIDKLRVIKKLGEIGEKKIQDKVHNSIRYQLDF